eukprot:m.260919 g.260919  ORF g.260919 m.260919 type:complete len:63 (+) comp15991_c0_seq2:583-771(+)
MRADLASTRTNTTATSPTTIESWEAPGILLQQQPTTALTTPNPFLLVCFCPNQVRSQSTVCK